MKVLVTGATGFVGSWLTKKLLDLGHQVRILSRSKEFKSPTPQSLVEVIPGNILDKESLKRATSGVHTVFHLAGVVGYSRAMRHEMEQVNVQGTQALLEAIQMTRVERFVHMSSVVAVGAGLNKNEILSENTKFNLHKYNLGYFETKLAAEKLVLSAARSGLNAVIVNPSTIYGPGDASKGSRSTQLKVARGKFPFYSSGGVNVIHIEDLIDGVLAAWERGRIGERYILSGENISIHELFNFIAESAGVKAPHIYLPNFAIFSLGAIGDALESIGKKGPLNSETARVSTLYHWFDNTKARQELGLNPRPAKEAIEASVTWMKSNHLI